MSDFTRSLLVYLLIPGHNDAACALRIGRKVGRARQMKLKPIMVMQLSLPWETIGRRGAIIGGR